MNTSFPPPQPFSRHTNDGIRVPVGNPYEPPSAPERRGMVKTPTTAAFRWFVACLALLAIAGALITVTPRGAGVLAVVAAIGLALLWYVRPSLRS